MFVHLEHDGYILIPDFHSKSEPETEMQNIDGDGVMRLRVYQKEELLRIGKTRTSTVDLPAWIGTALSRHPDCGHIILPAFTQARPQEVQPTDSWDKDILQEIKTSSQDLEEDIVHICELLELSSERTNFMINLSQEIEANLHSEFPECQVFPYGSFSSGFAFENCDLDIYADLGPSVFDESSKKPSDAWSARERTRAVGDILRRNERFRSATAITNAKIPIVKIKDRRTGIRCDVNTSSEKGVRNSEFLHFCKNYDKRVDQLVKIVKYFSLRHEIISSGVGSHFNSYTVVIMVIFFLQTKDILPSVGSLQEAVPEDIVENCNFAFSREMKHRSDNNQQISELLMEFFQFYVNFSFSTEIICPLAGRPVEKERFLSCEELPPALLGSTNNKLKTYKKVVVQDPFELSRNLAQNVTSSSLDHLISSFQFGVSILEESQCRQGRGELWRLFQTDDPVLVSRAINFGLE